MIEEIENIIDKSIQDSIEQFVLTTSFPWYHGSTINEYDTDKEDSKFIVKQGLNPYQFVHNVIKDSRQNSRFLGLVNPILDAIGEYVKKDLEVLKVKFNFLPRHTDASHHCPHVDIGTYKKENIKSVVYYVNDSDGDTYFFDETCPTERTSLNVMQTISPKKGKAVMFDSNIFHASSSPILSDKRIVINIVFKILD